MDIIAEFLRIVNISKLLETEFQGTVTKSKICPLLDLAEVFIICS